MRKYVPTLAALAIALASGAPLQAQHMSSMTMVGGQMMSPAKTIVDNAVNSADHTTLVAAVKAAGLVPTLESKGPFTVFAPTNAAFAALPAGTVDNLLKPENKPTLVKVLTYHVVAGDYTSAKLMAEIQKAGGTAHLKTVQGEDLSFKMNGPRNIVVVDSKGNAANISTYDVMQSNGVIQVIDRVLMP
ncbi:MAG: fasciclin domain-containing protein [Gemmatimonadaceae bacterium]